MPRLKRRVLAGFLVMAGAAPAQTALTWEQVRERFRENNPTLAAGRLAVDTARAAEITAYLRPNPTFNLSVERATNTRFIPRCARASANAAPSPFEAPVTSAVAPL